MDEPYERILIDTFSGCEIQIEDEISFHWSKERLNINIFCSAAILSNQRGRGHLAVYYNRPQSFIIMFSYLLA